VLGRETAPPTVVCVTAFAVAPPRGEVAEAIKLWPDAPFDVLVAVAAPPPIPVAVALAEAMPEPVANALAVALAVPPRPFCPWNWG
jgi:hypothetical protein